MSTVKVRFPPSPTGYCHVGTARMAIVNYLFARKAGGSILFRSEDTDRARSTREYEDDIVDQLHWLGLDWDAFVRTSELLSTHVQALKQLIDQDKAYVSREESKQSPGTMVEIVRLRNPGTIITFTDLIRGDITFDTTELGDFAIARAIDDPLYHLAVVVDDASEGITHVIRGEDHISNTPRQILIQEALGYTRPTYAHYPLHLGADRSKLSKRTGDVSVRSYREKGYLPEALLNYIAVLGWTPPSGREVLSLTDMTEEFELNALHTSGAVFDIEKLRWFNREYLLRKPEADFASYVLPVLHEAITARELPWDPLVASQLVPILKERVAVASDIREAVAAGEYDYVFADPALDAARIADKRSTPNEAARHLAHIRSLIAPLNTLTAADLKIQLWAYATEEGRGAVLWPLRYALTGKDKSPDPFIVAGMIGKDATIRRIDTALARLSHV